MAATAQISLLSRRTLIFAALSLSLAIDAGAQAASHRRALLIGVNDYTASHMDRVNARPTTTPAPNRDWPNLSGAVNDVQTLAEMLVLLYGFDRRDIVTLTDQQATRAAILQQIDQHLVQPAAKGDVLFFYYGGHGSQVRNSRSRETDGLDESIVPADSRSGALDIRDKELRPLFNRVLDRGARLTILIDACHSGSGARGLFTGAHPRGVNIDVRDVADGSDAARPEDRGALVLSASQDFDQAWETRDAEGAFHGAFSWAWIRALRDASAGEPAADTFLRAAARLRAETPFQEPVLAGNADARLGTFLGVRGDRRGDRTVVAIERVRADGTVVLQGGWVNGLAIGSELQIVSDGRSTIRLTVTALQGLAQSEARVKTQNRALPQSIKPGALTEVVGWAGPPTRPLRVWMPRVPLTARSVTAVAQAIAAEAKRRSVRWVSDPVETTPTYLLRRTTNGWELLGPNCAVERLATDDAAVAAVAKIPSGSSLFAQLAAPAAIVDAMSVGPGNEREDIAPTASPEDADYILVGRYSAHRVTYAWVRPSVRSADRRKTGLPLRTDWVGQDGRIAALRDALLRLRRIHAWQLLESPPEARAAYRLGLRRARDGERVKERALIGDETYELALRAESTPLAPQVQPRCIYIFTIDSYGRSTLLFPGMSGSVENRFPSTLPAPPEIRLGAAGTFEIAPPFGVDTYFLLTTDEPLPNPWILEWDGVRTRAASPPAATTTLEQLLLLTGDSSRTGPAVTPANWSLEKVMYESVAPRLKPALKNGVLASSRHKRP